MIDFISDFTKAIQRSGYEHIDYVPTQIVTEYFRHVFKIGDQINIDGIIYPSSKNEGKKAIVIVNMGSENTELVVCTKYVVWQRVIPIGGNNFTQAIADTFKLTFAKAEKLKRKAPMSKYAKQIFHAMRPVFTDMGSEIQRSRRPWSPAQRWSPYPATPRWTMCSNWSAQRATPATR